MQLSLKTPLQMCQLGLDFNSQPNRFSDNRYLEIAAKASAFVLSFICYLPALLLASLSRPSHSTLRTPNPIELPAEIPGPCKCVIYSLITDNLDLVRLVEQRGFDINTAALALEENIGNKISFISQDVMVGSEIQAADRELLGRLNISLVVNVPGDCRKHPAVGSDHISCNFFEGQQLSGGNTIRYIEANVADDGSTPLPLTELVRAIEQEVQRGGRVLIHCKEGKSRTGAVGIAWIMFNERKGFEEAFRLYKQRRGVPDGSRFIPTDILLDQLRAWNPRDVG